MRYPDFSDLQHPNTRFWHGFPGITPDPQDSQEALSYIQYNKYGYNLYGNRLRLLLVKQSLYSQLITSVKEGYIMMEGKGALLLALILVVVGVVVAAVLG